MEYIKLFAENFIDMFVDIAPYLMLGLLFVALMDAFVKKETILRHLGKDDFASVLKASVVGVPLPLCSCGVVPTALGLKKNGASNGAVVSFLTSTPQTGVDSILATYSLMGGFMAIVRPITAFLSGIIGGTLVDIFAKNEKVKVENISDHCSCGCGHEHHEEQHEEEHCCCGHEHEEHHEEEHCCCGHEHEEHHEEEHCCCCHDHHEEHHEEEHCCCGHEHEEHHEEEHCCCGHEHEEQHEEEHCCCGHEHEEHHEEEHCCCCHDHHEEHHEEEHCCCGHEHEEHHEEEHCSCCSHTNTDGDKKGFSQILPAMKNAYGGFLDELSWKLFVGIIIATLISTFIPADFFVKLGLDDGIFAMIAMVIVGLPMYICSVASIPIAISLVAKGISLGSAFVFLFAGPVTNIASIMLIYKALGKKITAIYLATSIVVSIAVGIFIDFAVSNFNLQIMLEPGSVAHGGSGIVMIAISIVFAILMVRGIVKHFMAKKHN